MRKLDIPFVDNSGGRCLQACTQMELNYYEPDFHPSESDMDSLTGYIHKQPTWDTLSLIKLYNRGYDITIIDPFDYEAFVDYGEEVLWEHYAEVSEEVADYQVETTNVRLEQERAEVLLGLDGIEYDTRRATTGDLRQCIAENRVARLEVNGPILAGKPGYTPHSVLVVGRGRGLTRVHNPDGKYGSKPNQDLSPDLLHAAWAVGQYALHAVSLKPRETGQRLCRAHIQSE